MSHWFLLFLAYATTSKVEGTVRTKMDLEGVRAHGIFVALRSSSLARIRLCSRMGRA